MQMTDEQAQSAGEAFRRFFQSVEATPKGRDLFLEIRADAKAKADARQQGKPSEAKP